MTTGATIRVLIVDDSMFMRKVISRIVEEGQGFSVAGVACNGREAVELVQRLKPDVVTMDVEMPEMNGVEALEIIMRRMPVPVVMLSSLTKRGAEVTLQCLSLGAVDFIPKPSGSVSEDIAAIRYVIWHKLRVAARARLTPLTTAPPPPPVTKGTFHGSPAKQVVAIAASTGGPRALFDVLVALPATLPATLLVVQHMPPHFTAAMAERFNQHCALEVSEASDGDALFNGRALIAPGGWHLGITPQRTTRLSDDPPRWGVRPAADILLEDVATVFPRVCLGVVLTGMGHDGTAGLMEIKAHGGATIAEDESTCAVFGMPRSAIEAGAADQVLPLPEIAAAIERWCTRGVRES